MQRYDPAAVEAKWQQVWHDESAFITPNPAPGEDGSRLQYVLEMLPYPSGDLHMGHVKNYTIGDALCHRAGATATACCTRWATTHSGCTPRTPRSREGRHPRDVDEREHRRDPRADEAHGLVDRLVARAVHREPEYYRWTQWIFLQLFQRGLAYKQEAPVNWCPVDQTVLANEQVMDGLC